VDLLVTQYCTVTKRSLLPALLALALLAPGWDAVRAPAPAAAAESVRNAVLGARIEDNIDAGDVDAFEVPLVAGTSLRVKLSTSDDAPASAAPLPEVVAKDPQGVEIGRRFAGGDGELRVTVASAGTYRFEVRAGPYAGEYELRIEGGAPVSLPQDSRTPVVVAGTPVVVHVDVAANSLVEIEVRRRDGSPPQIDEVTNALGQPLAKFIRRSEADRVRLEAIPVGVPGGLGVTVSAQGGGSGTYEVRTRCRFVSDRPSGGDDHDARRIVMLLAPGTDPAAYALANGLTLIEVEGDYAVFETPAGREDHEEEDADAAENTPGVILAAPDVLATLPEGSQSNAPIVGSDYGRADVQAQAALVQIHAATAQQTATGAGVVVAVLDGGVDATHELLVGRVRQGRDFVDDDLDASESANGLDDDGDGLVDEGWGHGTFVSSLVLAAAPGAEILPVRVLDSDGRGRSSDIAAGIRWAADNGARVMNLSFGTLGGNALIAEAVRYAQGLGVNVVASTGNEARTTVVDFPAALQGVIAVTALDATGARAAFANAGTATTLAAPGVDLVGAFPGGLYARWSGTSFAAAVVSGGIALVLETTPDVPPARVAAFLVRRARPFRPVPPRASRRFMGAGVLDLARLVR
jgi:subtilisin family serine protease